MKIFVKIDKHYNKTFYSPDCDTSRLLADLTGTKTLTIQALATIKQLGYQICTKTLQVLPVNPSKYIH